MVMVLVRLFELMLPMLVVPLVMKVWLVTRTSNDGLLDRTVI